MKELLVDILMNKMIHCDANQYHTFVRTALEKQRTLHTQGGDEDAARIIEAEMGRLDCLHQVPAIAS